MSDLVWDPRLDQRGVTLEKFSPWPGETYWKLVDARYLDPDESQGKHNIFVDAWDMQGKRLLGVPVVLYNGGVSYHLTEAKPGEPYAAAPAMFAAGNPYSVSVGSGPSDYVHGMGLGTIEHPREGIHVSYRLIFQRTKAEVDTGPTIPDNDWQQVLSLANTLLALAKSNLGQS